MSVRRKDTEKRLTLFRECDICGKSIITTADTPWVRMIEEKDADGKRHQYTRYYCSATCFKASYKHVGCFDGKTADRKRERERGMPPAKRAEKWKRYYAKHGEEHRARRMLKYQENIDKERADNKYYKNKRKMKKGVAVNENETCCLG